MNLCNCKNNLNCENNTIERTSISEPLDDLGHGGPLLSNSNVDAVQFLLLLSSVVESLLVDDGVDGNGGFAGLTITNDQLTLATTNGDKGVDGLDASLHGLPHRDTGDDARGLHTHTSPIRTQEK